MTNRPLILITNDDGIESPGLYAAAEAAAPLGEVLVVAPHTQQTAAGRSYTAYVDHNIYKRSWNIGSQAITAYSINGTPAQVVAAAVVDLIPRPVSLVISGINFGENIGSGVTISGTVGAAIEAAVGGIPALAVSRETPMAYHNSHSTDIDFSAAAHFTRYFARKMLELEQMPFDVDVLKVDIPASATSDTPWRVTTISRQRYHYALPSPPERRGIFVEPGYTSHIDYDTLEPASDIQAVCIDKVVSVSPLSFNLTSRVKLSTLKTHLIANGE